MKAKWWIAKSNPGVVYFKNYVGNGRTMEYYSLNKRVRDRFDVYLIEAIINFPDHRTLGDLLKKIYTPPDVKRLQNLNSPVLQEAIANL